MTEEKAEQEKACADPNAIKAQQGTGETKATPNADEVKALQGALAAALLPLILGDQKKDAPATNFARDLTPVALGRFILMPFKTGMVVSPIEAVLFWDGNEDAKIAIPALNNSDGLIIETIDPTTERFWITREAAEAEAQTINAEWEKQKAEKEAKFKAFQEKMKANQAAANAPKHASDCATLNEPAMPAGHCDCAAETEVAA